MDNLESQIEGNFKKTLLAGVIAGTGLVYAGLSNDNGFVEGLGYGILAADALYAFSYGLYKGFKRFFPEKLSKLNITFF